ncbi:hypothetical protein [Streptomyces cellostaticus]|nr:hypothetical protein [Streptomyces cellostaticus]
MGGVGRAVVKIYHGRNIDHRGAVWRIAQAKADKECPKAPNQPAMVM